MGCPGMRDACQAFPYNKASTSKADTKLQQMLRMLTGRQRFYHSDKGDCRMQRQAA